MAFVTSHPIQYQVPVFRCLAARADIDLTVLFAMLPDAASQGAGFGVAFEWDVPLLEGYRWKVLQNVSPSPSVTSYRGCDTPDIASTLRELQIDVVVVNGWVVKSCLQTLRAAKKLRIPCIVRGEANNLRYRSWWKRLIQRQLVRRYDAVLPIGIANREFYRGYSIAESSMFDARYCIENERFTRAATVAEPKRAMLRTHWKIPSQSVCFLYCGKFEPKKHPVELVDAFLGAYQRAANRGDATVPLHLLMVGDGELRRECERRLAQFMTSHTMVAPPVTFAGFLNQSQIVDAYVASDCLTLPSDSGETWGLVVNEAFACGRPAIVSDLAGCAADLIDEGKTGYVVPFGKWNRWSETMESLATKSSALKEMGGAARQLIQNYSPHAAAEGIAAAARAMYESR